MTLHPSVTTLLYLFEDLLQTSMRSDFHDMCAMPTIRRALHRLVIDWAMQPVNAFSEARNPRLAHCLTDHHLTMFREVGSLVYRHEQHLKIGGEMCVYSFGFVEMMSLLRVEIWIPDRKILQSSFGSDEGVIPLHDYLQRIAMSKMFVPHSNYSMGMKI
jgi:hypothetical protein